LERIVTILGGGPAGAAAAIAARREGCLPQVIEKSKFPRHKVCGEFFSPEIQIELERLGVWDAFLASGPARVRRMKLHFGRREKVCSFPEPGWGLSRFAFDALMFDGAQASRTENRDPAIIACGRRTVESRGQRLFGFKAHFDGPCDDAVELFFFDRCYVGVSTIEGGRTNVCGLGPEDVLRSFDFDFDRVLDHSPALSARIGPLTRSMKWLSTGPLHFRQTFDPDCKAYLAGDALSFVDPFTGSGLVAAVRTGALAGIAAARGMPVSEYCAQSRAILKKPFEIAGILRKAVGGGWAEWLAGLVPGRVLFALTRPGKHSSQ
jgi:flavin-dependent dehydrogenase